MSKLKWRRETQRENPLIKAAADICKEFKLGTVVLAVIEPDGLDSHIAVYSKPQLKDQKAYVIHLIDKFIEMDTNETNNRTPRV